MVLASSSRTYPAVVAELRERYLRALEQWDKPEIRATAALFGFDRRAYCDRYVQINYKPPARAKRLSEDELLDAARAAWRAAKEARCA